MLTTVLMALLPLAPQATPKAGDVAWLAGCWELTRGPRHAVEQWTAPEGGTLVGVSRTVSEGKTTEWEFLMIRESPRGLEYVAKPSRQAEAVFASTHITANEAVFENPQHDFPKRITYRLQADGGLVASIDGPMNGQPRTIAFPYTRAVCGK
jgi:uncharacterized protein DUF6265